MKKIQEYVDIVNQNITNAHDEIVKKITSEEENYSQKDVRQFVKRIQKETNLLLDEAELWNELRERE